MKSQIGYLQVVVPPDIIDQESSADVTVVEGANVTLQCKARGHPQPEIEVSLLFKQTRDAYLFVLLLFTYAVETRRWKSSSVGRTKWQSKNDV